MMALEPCPRYCAVGREALHQPPKARPVVHLGEMRHLMRDDVVEHRLGSKNQPPAEREVSPSRAAPPSTLCIAYIDPRHAAPDPCGELARPPGEFVPSHRHQIIPDPARQMRRIATNADLAIDDHHRRPRGV